MVLDVQYVCGFVDGEGCFANFMTGRGGPQWTFNVTQKSKEVLEEIADTIGMPQYIYQNKYSGTYVLQTSSHKWIAKVKEFFKANQLFVKRQRFEEWCASHEAYINRPRPRSLIGEEKIEHIQRLRAEGCPIRKTAKIVGVGVGTVQRWEHG